MNLTKGDFHEILNTGKHMKWNYLPGSPAAQVIQAEREKWVMEKNRELNEEKRRAREQTIETTKYLITVGLTDEQIFEATKLPMNEISAIRQEGQL